MKLARYCIAAVSVPVVLATFAPEGFALPNSNKSVTVFPAEGNLQCSDYSSNAVVREMATDALEAAGTLTGPDSPSDGDASGETATYSATLTDGKATTLDIFESSAPINYLLLKAPSEVTVYFYKTGGETWDETLALASGGPISAISLCYGIPAAAPPRRAGIPHCEERGTIDQTSVGCPTDGSQTLVCNLELKDAFENRTKTFGLDNGGCCTCNVPVGEQLSECDPNIAPPIPGACPQGGAVEPASIIEGVRIPTTCIYTTILGKRTAFCEPEVPPSGPRCFVVRGQPGLFCEQQEPVPIPGP